MRASIIGVFMGITVAISLKNDKILTSQVIRASLATEISLIVILGLVELY